MTLMSSHRPLFRSRRTFGVTGHSLSPTTSGTLHFAPPFSYFTHNYLAAVLVTDLRGVAAFGRHREHMLTLVWHSFPFRT